MATNVDNEDHTCAGCQLRDKGWFLAPDACMVDGKALPVDGICRHELRNLMRLQDRLTAVIEERATHA